MRAIQPQHYLDSTVEALRSGGDWQAALDAIPLPAYATDPDGSVTYWNQACVDFAGREPKTGQDRWCVTWQLFTLTLDPLPHDECPMAKAIKTRTSVRDKIAITMRPDGSRRAFVPYPTPLFDDDGNLTGAINLLIDVTDEQAAALQEQAARCRRLVQATTDPQASQILSAMAQSYAAAAAALRSQPQQ